MKSQKGWSWKEWAKKNVVECNPAKFICVKGEKTAFDTRLRFFISSNNTVKALQREEICQAFIRSEMR